MKTVQNSVQNQENQPEITNQSSVQENITISVPNPQIYISKAQNRLKKTKFFQKTLKSQVIFVFLLVFFIINIVMAASNIKTKQLNKKLNEDMTTIYEMVEVLNVARKVDGEQIKYLENLLSENNVYLSPMYGSDISEKIYKEYEDKINNFEKVDYNAVLDQFLNKDYTNDVIKDRKNKK